MAAILGTGLPWAADNGCFSGFDEKKFMRFLKRITGCPRCLFVVCPDVVGDAKETCRLYRDWEYEVRSTDQPIAFVLQDGQEDLPLPAADAYFIGGSTRFKLSLTAANLAAAGKRKGAWVHMGRVNSRRRLVMAEEIGCDSVDGSSLSMFGDHHIEKFCRWAGQLKDQPLLY